MKIKLIYTCDCCGIEFREPDYFNPSIGILKYRRLFNKESTGGDELTLGVNGEDVCLCNKCMKKFEQSLIDIGFKRLHNGCSSVSLI